MASEAMRSRGQRHALLLAVMADVTGLRNLSPEDMDFAVRLARRARVLGRVALAVNEAGIAAELPHEVAEILSGALVTADARLRSIRWEMQCAERAFDPQERRQIVVLKGAAYALARTANARGRLVADVDLLTAKSNIEAVESRLSDAGWLAKEMDDYDQRYYREWTHEIPPLVHRERDVEVDVHFNILPQAARLKPPASLLLEAARDVEDSGFRVLAPADMVLHAAAHLMFDADLADDLRDLLDVALLLEHFAANDEHFWTELAVRAEALDLGRPAWHALRYCERLLGTDVPAVTIQSLRQHAPSPPVQWLMDRLVPLGLLPPDLDRADPLAACARWLLFVRSHWIRMPPWLLIYHSVNKFFRRRAFSAAAKEGSA